MRWLKAVPGGLIAIRDNGRTRRDHQRRLHDHESQRHQQRRDLSRYESAEKRRVESLADARAAREREERVATELGHVAHQARRLAASLREDVVVHQVRELKNRYAELNEPMGS